MHNDFFFKKENKNKLQLDMHVKFMSAVHLGIAWKAIENL